jgi:predicted RecA/RadA family phage recombinase
MNNYIKPGNTLTFTAPSGGVTSGLGYKIGQLFVVAAITAAEGDEFEGKTDGVYTLPKTTGAAWTEGQLLYWDDTNDKVITTATGNLLIGCAAAAAGSDDTTGTVRLNATVPASAADGVSFSEARVFVSTEQTGTGSAQNVAHGLGATPAAVTVHVTESDGNAFDVAQGTHTSTNVVVTVTSGVKFTVLAWA